MPTVTVSPQTTDTIMMIRPANFGYNAQTAESNAFQSDDQSLHPADITERAKAEFDEMVARLREVGIKVLVIDDTEEPRRYDAVFPNNWITMHHNGMVITYPLTAPSRRLERREDILTHLAIDFKVTEVIRLEEHEQVGKYLEGTGSMILDRANNYAYACLSPRTHEELLLRFCTYFDCEPVVFTAVDAEGQQIYHTNVMMCMAETFVVICMESVHNAQEKTRLYEVFERTGKEVVEISYTQMLRFAGNMLQVRNTSGDRFLVMSTQAYNSLTPEQVSQVESHCAILHSPIPTIETYGGGSARCMMAEVFLEER